MTATLFSAPGQRKHRRGLIKEGHEIALLLDLPLQHRPIVTGQPTNDLADFFLHAILAEFGAARADTGRGLSLRMDNGTQYTADDLLNQVKFWGIAPSFAFVAQPQTNGVAERFNRTLKEQAIRSHLRQRRGSARPVTAFRDRYNHHWHLEKLGFLSPLEARQAYAMRTAA